MLKFFCTLLVLIPTIIISSDNIQNFSYGKVNWTKKKIIVTGSGISDPKNKERAVTEKMARKDAYKNAMEVLKSMIVKKDKLETFINKNSNLRKQIEKALQSGRLKGKKYYDDGGVDIILEIDLNSILLANTFINKSIKYDDSSKKEKKYTSLLIDLSSVRYDKRLFPQVKDEKGKFIYSLELLNSNNLKSNFIPSYFKNKRKLSKYLGSSPLEVKVKKVDKNGTIIISNVDSNKLQKSNLSFLKEGKIYFISR